MTTIVFSTNNKHKIEELKSLVNIEGIEILTKREYGVDDFEVDELGSTLEENALIKARALKFAVDDCICIADDTGLFVDELKGEPGVHSARYAGEIHDDKANIDLLLTKLKNKVNRNAYFKTCIAVIMPDAREYVVTGICRGYINGERRGTEGFGYDSVFIPEGYDVTFAEMGINEKNLISHRRKAYDNFIKLLSNVKGM